MRNAVYLWNPIFAAGPEPWTPETPSTDLLQYWNDVTDPTIANPAVLNYRPIFQYNGASAGNIRPYQPGRCYVSDGTAYGNLGSAYPVDVDATSYWVCARGKVNDSINQGAALWGFSFGWSGGSGACRLWLLLVNTATAGQYYLAPNCRRPDATVLNAVRYNSIWTPANGEEWAIVFGWDNVTGTGKVFMQGTEVDLAPTTPGAIPSGNHLLGANTGSIVSSNIGQLHDVRVYTGFQMTRELADEYLASKPLTGQEADAWYKCDEGVDSTILDSSGNGNDGTVVNLYTGFHAEQNEYSFQNEVGFSEHNIMNKTAGGAAWNNARAYIEVPGDFELSMTYGFTNYDFYFALVSSLTSTESQGYGFLAQSGFYAFELGSIKKTESSDDTDDVLTLKRVGSTLEYYINGVLWYTSLASLPPETYGYVYCNVYDLGEVHTLHFKAQNFDPNNLTLIPQYIPRNEAIPAEDVQGNPLQHFGRVPGYGALSNLPCVTISANLEWLSCPHLAGSETVTSYKGTAVPTISAGRIDFTQGTIFDLQLSDGTHYPLCERDGNIAYDINGNNGTWQNYTLPDLWAGSQNEYAYCQKNGYTRETDPYTIDKPVASNPGRPAGKWFLETIGDQIDMIDGVTNFPWGREIPAIVYAEERENGTGQSLNSDYQYVSGPFSLPAGTVAGLLYFQWLGTYSLALYKGARNNLILLGETLAGNNPAANTWHSLGLSQLLSIEAGEDYWIACRAHTTTFGATARPNLAGKTLAFELLGWGTPFPATWNPASESAGKWDPVGVQYAGKTAWVSDYQFGDTSLYGGADMFTRIQGNKQDRFLHYRDALTGNDLTKAQEYTQ